MYCVTTKVGGASSHQLSAQSIDRMYKAPLPFEAGIKKEWSAHFATNLADLFINLASAFPLANWVLLDGLLGVNL
jgi:hypothetical protein